MSRPDYPAELLPVADPLLGSKVGPYTLVRCIGHGGMGVVYEARHEHIGQRAAIKVLLRSLAQDARILKRFLDEARMMTLVQHEGIVKVFDYGQLSDGLPYIMMEFLEGESLQARLDRTVPLGHGLAMPEALEIARQVASALMALHKKNVIHRDLKPENLFLIPDSLVQSGERAKLLDFGLAKILDQQVQRTADGSLLGTPLYMSPEQWEGGSRLGPKSDVYSLGALLFELLIGRPPFHSTSASQLMYQHLNQPPPLLAEVTEDAPPKLGALLAAMLAKDPAARPDMADVVGRIEPLRALVAGLGSLRLLGSVPVAITEIKRDGMAMTLAAEQPTVPAREATTLAAERPDAPTAEEPTPSQPQPPAHPVMELPPQPSGRVTQATGEASATSLQPTEKSPLSVARWPQRQALAAATAAALLLVGVVGFTLRHRNIPTRPTSPAAEQRPAPALAPVALPALPAPPVPPALPAAAPPVESPAPSPKEAALPTAGPPPHVRKTKTRPPKRKSQPQPVVTEPKNDEPMSVFREH
jgi:serine/threonine-protein kinase